MNRTIPHMPWQASNTQSGGAHISPGPWIESRWLSRDNPNAKGCCGVALLPILHLKNVGEMIALLISAF